MPIPSVYLEALRTLCPEPVEIVGGGVEGQSTAKFLLAAGYERVTVRDRNPQLTVPDGCDKRTGDGYLQGIPDRATIVRSAGIRPDLREFQEARQRGCRVTSQLPLFLGLFQGVRKGRVVGITGTFGKGTVTTILSQMLDAGQVAHVVGGNIGTAMLDLLYDAAVPEVAVLELSSFQLCDLELPEVRPAGMDRLTFVPRIGVAGRVTIEHLDWHRDQVEYWNAKARLCEESGEDDHAVYFSDDPGSVFVGLAGSSIPHGVGLDGELRPGLHSVRDDQDVVILRREDMRVPGAFQLANAALAWTTARILGVDDEACLRAAIAFSGLPHRLQFAGQIGAVRYYNDSYATRPEATLAAVEALTGAPLALILGGSDKGIDFGELADGLRASAHLRHVSLIGATAARLREAIEKAGTPHFALCDCPDLPTAIDACEKALANAEGAVLLSPACASFGLFQNYKQRGEAFLAEVQKRQG